LLVEDRAGVGVEVGIEGVLVHAGALSLPEARSWKDVPDDGDGVEEPNKDDGVTLGDLTEEASIWAKGTDGGG
jgi:hypothetical protein